MMWVEGGWNLMMYLEDKSPGGAPSGPFCLSCNKLIGRGERARVEFRTDPDGTDGLTGDYHIACSKPYAALARVINMNMWR
jgi:hypothetical protein